MHPDERFQRAQERFESQWPLLKLLVARVLPMLDLRPQFPNPQPQFTNPQPQFTNPQPQALPLALVRTAAIALWLAALEETPEASFGDAAETAMHGALMRHLHLGVSPYVDDPEELQRYAERLEELARALAIQASSGGLIPHYGNLTNRPYAMPPAPEFVQPTATSATEGRLLEALSLLVRRRWGLILGVVVATEALVGVLVLKEPKVFKATVTLNTGIASGQSASGAAIDWFKAGALMGNLSELLTSRTVLERTIARLSLATTPEKLAKQIDVEKVGQTDLMHISIEARTSRQAADLANAHVDEFLRYYRQSQGADAQHADQFIEQQLQVAARRLSEAEDQLKAFKSSHVPEEQTTYATQLADLHAQRGEVERSLAASRRGLATVESEIARLRRDPMFARTVQESTEVDAAGDRLRTLKQNLDDARQAYGADHPVVRSLQRQIDKASGNLQATTAKVAAADPAHADVIARRIALKVDVAQQEAKLASLDRAIAELAPKAQGASVADVTYKELLREVALREAEYQRLTERSGQTRLAANGASLLPITIVDAAEPPAKPESNKGLIKLALGAVLAILVGLVLAYVLEVRAKVYGAREGGA